MITIEEAKKYVPRLTNESDFRYTQRLYREVEEYKMFQVGKNRKKGHRGFSNGSDVIRVHDKNKK